MLTLSSRLSVFKKLPSFPLHSRLILSVKSTGKNSSWIRVKENRSHSFIVFIVTSSSNTSWVNAPSEKNVNVINFEKPNIFNKSRIPEEGLLKKWIQAFHFCYSTYEEETQKSDCSLNKKRILLYTPLKSDSCFIKA